MSKGTTAWYKETLGIDESAEILLKDGNTIPVAHLFALLDQVIEEAVRKAIEP